MNLVWHYKERDLPLKVMMMPTLGAGSLLTGDDSDVCLVQVTSPGLMSILSYHIPIVMSIEYHDSNSILYGNTTELLIC